MKIERILVTAEGERYFVRDLSRDFHTKHGYIKKEELTAKDGSRLLSNTNKQFFIFRPSFIDIYKKIERMPQIIPLKDAALIVAETGIGKKSRILDAGVGSGALACFLANIAKEVIAYEIREDFLNLAKRNIEMLGLRNVKVKHKNIYEGVDEKNIDLVTLDLPEPWKAIGAAEKALKVGGFLVSYSPTTPQVADFINAIAKNKNFSIIKTIEIMEREWEISERKVRPKSQSIGHSGFLSFVRKVGNG